MKERRCTLDPSKSDEFAAEDYNTLQTRLKISGLDNWSGVSTPGAPGRLQCYDCTSKRSGGLISQLTVTMHWDTIEFELSEGGSLNTIERGLQCQKEDLEPKALTLFQATRATVKPSRGSSWPTMGVYYLSLSPNLSSPLWSLYSSMSPSYFL
eukprot:Gb_31332 [translate_table: standard]